MDVIQIAGKGSGANMGALTVDHLTNLPELARMGIVPSLADQQLALLKVGLLEIDPLDLVGFDRLEASGLQQLGVSVGDNCFLMQGGFENDSDGNIVRIQFQGQNHS